MTTAVTKRKGQNIPNIITSIRIALLPFIYFFFLAHQTVDGGFIPYGKLIAIFLFILASVTDFLDGMIARKYNLVTNMGKLLDPMADKMLSFTGLIIIALTGVLPPWATCTVIFVILGRDFSVDCLRMVAATKGIVVSANWSGKLRTIIAMIAMPYLMLMAYNNEVLFVKDTAKIVLDITGYVLIGVAVVLCAYSWFHYFYINRAVFKDDKAEVKGAQPEFNEKMK